MTDQGLTRSVTPALLAPVMPLTPMPALAQDRLPIRLTLERLIGPVLVQDGRCAVTEMR
jgi:hypothetical protein